MDKKTKWLKSIGAVEIRNGFRWHVPDGNMFYSEEYIKNTPLEELQVKYKEHHRLLSLDKQMVAIRILRQMENKGFDEWDIANVLDEAKSLLIENTNDYGKMARRFKTIEKIMRIITIVSVFVMIGCYIAISAL